MPGPGPYMGKAPYLQNPFEGNLVGDKVEFTIGTETTNTINVGIQLYSGPNELYEPGSVGVYLSDDADGLSIVATAPSGGWAIGTDGLLIPIVANKYGTLVTEADGHADITITETGADTFYAVVILPSGQIVVSDAITFA